VRCFFLEELAVVPLILIQVSLPTQMHHPDLATIIRYIMSIIRYHSRSRDVRGVDIASITTGCLSVLPTIFATYTSNVREYLIFKLVVSTTASVRVQNGTEFVLVSVSVY